MDQTQIIVGSLKDLSTIPPAAATKVCDEVGRVGSLVVIPGSGEGEAFGIMVVVGVGQSTEVCLSNGFRGGCIVAKRSLSFVAHHPLSLPIELEVECLDIPCGATETCRKGTCVPAFLEDPEGCADPSGCDGGMTGGAANVGGSSTGGAASGGAPSSGGVASGGGSSSGGSGGATPVCGNDVPEGAERCDDGNVVSGDGCSANCLVEYLVVSDVTEKKLKLYSWFSGAFVRDLATEATTLAGFFPTSLVQSKGGDIYVRDTNAGILRLSREGALLETHPVSVALGIALTSSSLLVGEQGTGIGTYDLATFTKGPQFSATNGAWGLSALDDRWVLATTTGFGEVFLVDGTAANVDQILYDGGSVFDVSQTGDGRILVPDNFSDKVSELVPTKPRDAANPLGLPLTQVRNVTTSSPYGAVELLDGNWFVVSSTGITIFDPDTGLSLSTPSTNSLRAAELYEGL